MSNIKNRQVEFQTKSSLDVEWIKKNKVDILKFAEMSGVTKGTVLIFDGKDVVKLQTGIFFDIDFLITNEPGKQFSYIPESLCEKYLDVEGMRLVKKCDFSTRESIAVSIFDGSILSTYSVGLRE